MYNEIINGNRLIAEFMGWEERESQGFYDFPENFPSYLVDEYHCIPPGMMLFHKSWDWLMPVVEKIESMILKDVIDYRDKNYEMDKLRFPICFTVNQKEAWIQYYHVGISGGDAHFEFMKKSSSLSKIDAVWNVIVEFIKWYNNQKT